MADLNTIIALIKGLSNKDKKRLIKSLENDLGGNANSIKEFLTDKRFENGRVCPHCGCTHIVKNGHRADGTQKYVCKDCGKSFTITTNSIVFGTRKDMAIWQEYIECMMNGWSVRKSARKCGIHRNTAFRWRHKILDALTEMMKQVKLAGIVEADETYFPKSYKGNHKKSKTFTMPRPPHKRGGMTEKRGISSEQICVPCAVNRDGLSVGMPAKCGKPIPKAFHKVFDDRIDSESILVTDGEKSYKRFTMDNGIQLVAIRGGKGKKNGYHIQHINSYHSRLKTFMDSFKGVSTKYLGNYIVWHNLVNYAPETEDEKAQIMFGFVTTYPMKETNDELSHRPVVPVL